MKRYRAELLLLLILLILIAPLCGILFRCGCTFLWSGGDSHCNVHHSAPPHCPWCRAPGMFAAEPFSTVYRSLSFLTIYLTAVVCARFVRKIKNPGLVVELAVGLFAAALAALLVGWIYAAIAHYPFL